MSEGAPGVEVRRAADRMVTRTPWRTSAHSFSFGPHYDPANTAHGALVASNEDLIAPGAGFPLHEHRDVEIVTWVLSGSLLHEDSTGRAHVVRPGAVQRLRAGRGVQHAETNDAWRLEGPPHREPLRLVQMWLLPDATGGDPAYELRSVDPEELAAGLVTVASGLPGHEAALRLTTSAALHVTRLPVGGEVLVPDAPYVHVFLPLGVAELEGAGPLAPGDAVRLTGAGGRRLTASAPTEVLVCEMHPPR